jgi:hypothetical protein
MSLLEKLSFVDRLITNIGDEKLPSELMIQEIQIAICRTIQGFCSEKSQIADEALSDGLERATTDAKGRRDAALLILRCLGEREIIPENDEQSQLQRRVVTLIEQGTPDFSEYFKLSDQKQTIDKYNILRSVHRQCWELLNPLRTLPMTPDGFSTHRQEIFKSINHKALSLCVRGRKMW